MKPSQPVASSSSSTTKDPEKKKKKKAKIAASFDPSEQAESGSKVVEVVDPSLAPAIPEPVSTVKKATKRDRKEIEEDEMFRDSRGTGPSEWDSNTGLRELMVFREKDGRGVLDIQRSRIED